jgi:hypothetical protein
MNDACTKREQTEHYSSQKQQLPSNIKPKYLIKYKYKGNTASQGRRVDSTQLTLPVLPVNPKEKHHFSSN